MALPTMANINTAVDNLFAALSEDKTLSGMQAAVESLNEMFSALKNAYIADIDLLVTDLTDATLTAFIAATGELGVANSGVLAPVGLVFSVQGAGDTTDNGLQTAKGSAVADNDVFQVTSSSAVAFLGSIATLDFTAEEREDFVSLGA